MREFLLIGEQICDPSNCKIKPLVEHENNTGYKIIVAANGDAVLQTIDECHEQIQTVIIDSCIRVAHHTPYKYGTTRPNSGEHVIGARIRTTSIPDFAVFQTAESPADDSDELAGVEILRTQEDLRAFLKRVAENDDTASNFQLFSLLPRTETYRQ